MKDINTTEIDTTTTKPAPEWLKDKGANDKTYIHKYLANFDQGIKTLKKTFDKSTTEAILNKNSLYAKYKRNLNNVESSNALLSDIHEHASGLLSVLDELSKNQQAVANVLNDNQEVFEALTTIHQQISKLLSLDEQPSTEALQAELKALKDEFTEYKENSIYIPPRRLPKQAPVLWEDWKKNNPNKDIEEFLQEVWGKWLEEGELYQDDLGKLDPKALKRIKNYCSRIDSVAPSDLVPSSASRTKKYIQLLSNSPIFYKISSLIRLSYR